MSDIVVDEIGRTFCKAHRKDQCNICCMSFTLPNEQAEIRAGLRRPKTRAEELAEQKVMLDRGLAFMYQQPPATRQSMQGNIDYHKKELARVEQEMKALMREPGQDEQFRKAIVEETDKANATDAENRAMAQAMARENPGQTNLEFGGEQYARLYDKFAAPPPSAARDKALDPYTCSYCQKRSTTTLKCCARCMKQAYCNGDCQRKHWKAHKKTCVPAPVGQVSREEIKKMPLTWKQLEQFGEAPGEILEVRYMSQEPGMRLIALCKDREGIVKRVACYTNSRDIPGFVPGKVMVWTHPRFRYFMDGSTGARIEESDLQNIKIKD